MNHECLLSVSDPEYCMAGLALKKLGIVGASHDGFVHVDNELEF
jgi:hypothetical protein